MIRSTSFDFTLKYVALLALLYATVIGWAGAFVYGVVMIARHVAGWM